MSHSGYHNSDYHMGDFPLSLLQELERLHGDAKGKHTGVRLLLACRKNWDGAHFRFTQIRSHLRATQAATHRLTRLGVRCGGCDNMLSVAGKVAPSTILSL